MNKYNIDMLHDYVLYTIVKIKTKAMEKIVYLKFS